MSLYRERHGCNAALSAAIAVAVGAGQAEAATEAGVRLGHDANRTRVVIDLAKPATHRLCRAADTNRYLLAIDGAVLSPNRPLPTVSGTLLGGLETTAGKLRCANGARLGLPSDERLVFELAPRQDVRLESFELGPGYGAAHRIVVDFYPAPSSAAVAAAPDAKGAGEVGPGTSGETVLAPESEPAADAEEMPPAATAAPAEAVAREDTPAVPDSAAADDIFDSADDSLQAAAGPFYDVSPVGYLEAAAAYTISDPSHWSRLRTRVELGATGRIGESARFKVVGRAQGDAAYLSWNDFYPDAVQDDQQSNFWVREAYVDVGTDDWEFRLGRQHVVWGEMVGLFLADVVSARDTREFFLEEFETMRIPQWAVRAERYLGDAYVELLWIPYMSYDFIGEPGADFYPFPLEAGTPVREVTPSRSDFRNQGLGARFAYFVNGWDLSGFYFQSSSVAPTLYRTETGFELRNDQIEQVGGTFSKDFFSWVLKGEAVYTAGRNFLSVDPGAAFGLEESDALDYVVGVTIPRGNWRFDAQVYGRHVFDHRPTMGFDRNEVGITLLANYSFGDAGDVELLYLSGLNREDWSLQPSVSWNLAPSWRLRAGADLFGGEPLGLLGQFDDADRVFIELRRWF